MHDEADPDLSLAQILYALVLALVPYIESLLADPALAHSPALRRLAATLRILHPIAVRFGKPGAAAAEIPSRILSVPRRAPATCRAIRRRIRELTRAATPLPARYPGLPQEPARTLEL